jgi:DNA-directed RNA polymerase beta subunit
MIRYDIFKQYTQVTNGLRFIKKDKPYMLLYYSENSTFIEDFSVLNLKPLDVKMAIIPRTIIPRTFLTPPLIKTYKSLNLIPYSSTQKFPAGKNFIYDPTLYMKNVDDTFNPGDYRRRAGMLIKNQVDSAFLKYPDYKKILIYSVDITKPFNNFINRKSFPLIQDLRNNEFLFDDLIFVVINSKGARYRSLVRDKKFLFPKILLYLKPIKYVSIDEKGEDEEETDEVKQASIKVNDALPAHIKNKENIKDAVKNYLKKDQETAEKITSDDLGTIELKRIAIKSVFYKLNNNITKSNNIVKNIAPEKVDKTLQVVDKKYADQLIPKQDVVNTSDSVVVKNYDVKDAIDNKTPDHLFTKRQLDFKKNLYSDITNSFKTLETKEFPLKVEKIEIIDKPEKKNEIMKSDISLVKVSLKNEEGKSYKVTIEIPKINPDSGTFRVHGQTKCLINQIILCPISFPKPYDSKFESSYSSFHIRSKRTKRFNSLEIYMGSFKNLPLLVLLAYSFGFNDIMKQYDLSYTVKTDKPKKSDVNSCKINQTEYVYFDNVNTELKKELISSFIKEGVDEYDIKHPFGSKEYFTELIIKITGRVSSTTFLINVNLENIVDPVAKQVLINKQLPYELKDIMYYMASRVVTGYAQARNDLNNQRIRGSEILVHLAQKQILSAYTVYKEQVLAGNKNAEFSINSTKVLSSFINSEIVVNMEYANPIEEMAVMTRVSPVGKAIGGIADENAIQASARNVSPSYFGNIDPLDTPEGSNIGISQQLAIDALVTSARGLFETRPVSNKEGAGILSTSTALIPFVENNDGNRIQFGANQARQMLPLKNPEPPIVRSGYEGVLTNVLSDNFVKKVPERAKVLKITHDTMFLVGASGKKYTIDLSPIHLKSGTGRDTLSIFNVKVIEGQIVGPGQILAEGSCIKDGTISLGRTLCAGYMPYKGYNFEDGIVINEKLMLEDKLTSLHGIEEEVLISEKDRVLFIANIGDKLEKGKPLLRKTIGEIEQLVGYEENEDDTTVVYGQELIKTSPGGTIVDIDVFCNISDEKYPKLKFYIDRTRKRYGTSIDEKFIERGSYIKGILVKFKIEQELKIGISDKLTNRVGAKGIITLMEKDDLMPRTPWGEKLDIILNPLGVIGRMNLGQLYELYCGLISKSLTIQLVASKTKKQFLDTMFAVLSKLDTSQNKQYTRKMVNNISKLNDKQFSLLVTQIKTSGFTPIIIPPFKAPKSNDIMDALKILNLKPGYNLYLPEFSTKTRDAVPVGYLYISKLEHIGEMKIHGRSTGPVTGKTSHPTSGKKREGAQRLGESDVDVLLGYNCPKLLTELMGPLSDDLISKNEMISEIIQDGETKFRTPKISPAKDLLNAYFISLMLERA